MSGRRGIIALALLAAAGCDIPESALAPGERHHLVHAVLDAGSVKQLIVLEYSDGARRTGEWLAEVTLILPDGRELRAQGENRTIAAETYSVDLAPGDVQPGVEYGLRVLDGTKLITGATTLPLAQPVTDSGNVEPFSLKSDTLRLSWPRVQGASAYHVAVRSAHQFDGEVFFETYYSAFADTSIALAGALKTLDDDPVFLRGGKTTVVVSAVDENFYTYYHPQLDPFAGAPQSRLNGALGVFGSMVPVLIRRLDVIP